MSSRTKYSLLVLAALSIPGAVLADETNPDFIPEAIESVAADSDAGFKPKLAVGANLNFTQNKNVVSATEGLSFTGGFILDGGFSWLGPKEHHEWISSLNWNLAYTRTPTVPRFIKSLDALQVQSMWLYHLPSASWFGPFAELRLTSMVFPGYYVGAADLEVSWLDVEGNEVSVTSVASPDSVELTSPFAPTTVRESVGAFLVPVEQDVARVEVRAGVGAWESFVQEGYFVNDNADTAAFEVQQMQDSVQVGSEVNVSVSGAVNEQVTYSASAALMQPFIYNVESDLTGLELLNSEYSAGLSVKLWEWASLQYQFKAVRTPLVVDVWQIQNALMVTFSNTLVGGDDEEPPPEEETADDCACGEAAAAPVAPEETAVEPSEETTPPAEEEAAPTGETTPGAEPAGVE